MANSFLTPDMIAREALMLLSNNTVAANLVHRDREQEFTGMKIGDTVTIRRRANFRVDEFATEINVQNINESGVPLKLEKHFDVSVPLTSRDLTLELEDFSAQIVAPAMISIAEAVDSYIYSLGDQIPTLTLRAANDLALRDVARVDAQLLTQKVPLAGRSGLVSPNMKVDLMSLEPFHRADARGDEGTALREASMGRVMGVDWYGVQGVRSHTTGAAPATGMAVDGAVDAGATTLALKGATGTQGLEKGDVLTIAGSGQHVVTESVAAVSGNFAAVKIYPALRANVVDDAAVTKAASHEVNVVGDLRGISLAVVPLALPMEAGRGATMSWNGLSIRVVTGYDQKHKTDIISFDLLCGGRVTQPELLTRFA